MAAPQTHTEASIATAARRILIVDDEIDTRCLLAEHFRTAGFIVVEACSADEAMTLWRSVSFEAVITDVQMPGSMDGVALADALRSSSPDTFIVVVSGLDLSRELELKGTEFLQKPYLVSSLVERVKNKMNRP